MTDMTTILTCDKCGLHYRASLLPHKCADWTQGKPPSIEQPRPEQGSGTQSKVIDQLLDIAIYAEDIDRRVAARVQIVKMLDQHSTLVAQQERLLTALREMLNRFYPHTCDRGPVCAKCEALVAASKVLTTIEQEGTEGR